MTDQLAFTPPEFYIVGAAKAGTTAIYNFLRAHPEVFLPEVKEPGFYAFAQRSPVPRNGPYDRDYVKLVTTDRAGYASLYCGAQGLKAGDISPAYLLFDDVAARIASERPDAKIVIILRDPVKRAFSQYLHHLRDHLEPCFTFEEALAEEEQRLGEGWSWGHGYAAHGHYAAQIARFLEHFPREQILFLEYEQLQNRPDTLWQDLLDHLGLTWRPLESNERVNATQSLRAVASRPKLARRISHPSKVQSLVKSFVPRSLRTRVRSMLEGPKRPTPTLSEATQKMLSQRYLAERADLEQMTGLSLSHWAW